MTLNQSSIKVLLSMFSFSLGFFLVLEIISVVHGLMTHPTHNLNSFYFLASLIGLLVWLLIDIKNKKIQVSQFSFKSLLFPLLFATILFSSGRFIEVALTQNIAVVEENQATVFDYEPINNWAAQEQQPPADYFLVQFFQKTFGYNHLGLRLKNLVAAFVFLALAGALICHITQSWWMAVTLMAVFVCNEHVYNHLWFARPLTLGLFFTVLTNIIIVCRHISWPLSVIATVFYLQLTSCGFQPMIGLFSITLATLLYTRKKSPEFAKKITYGFFIASVLFIPVLGEMTYMSYLLQQFHHSTRTFIMSLNEMLYLSTWKIFFTHAYFSPVIWVFLALGFSYIKLKKLQTEQVKLFLTNWILFTITFVIIFKLFIDYPMHEHYIFLSHWNALILITVILSLSVVQKMIYQVIFVFLAVIGIVIQSRTHFVPFLQRDLAVLLNKNFSFHDVYRMITEVAHKNDHIYILSYQPPGVPSRTRFVANRYYPVNQTGDSPSYRPPMAKPFYLEFNKNYWSNGNFLYGDILARQNPQRAIFVHLKKDLEEDFSGYSPVELPAGIEHISNDIMDIYILSVSDNNLAKSVLPFYVSLVKSSNYNPSIVPILETALHISMHLKEKETFLTLFNNYKKFETMDFIHHPHYIRYHDCRFLIDYFKTQAISLGWIK